MLYNVNNHCISATFLLLPFLLCKKKNDVRGVYAVMSKVANVTHFTLRAPIEAKVAIREMLVAHGANPGTFRDFVECSPTTWTAGFGKQIGMDELLNLMQAQGWTLEHTSMDANLQFVLFFRK
jgi:hypothetical protein